MKKLFLIIIIVSFITIVKAQTVNISYYPEGGTTITSGYIVEDNLIKNQYGMFEFTYNTEDTIRLSKIVLYKRNNTLVKDKEWYVVDNDGNKYYYSNNTEYKIKKIVNRYNSCNMDIDEYIKTNTETLET